MDMGHGAWEHDTQALMHRCAVQGHRTQGVMHGGMVPLKYETPFHLYTASEIIDTLPLPSLPLKSESPSPSNSLPLK